MSLNSTADTTTVESRPAPESSLRAAREEHLPALPRELVEKIRLALRGLQYGHLTIVIQDGRVVQIDRIQQRRLFSTPRKR